MESGNDYVIQVKGNQKKLHSHIIQAIENNQCIDTYVSTDTKRGRIEYRKITIYAVEPKHPIFEKWVGLTTIIRTENYGKRGGRSYSKEHYYISSILNKSAEYFAKGIRSHWGVENKLHWVKDVILNEDKSRIKSGRIATNLSLVKSTLINIYRLNGYQSIKKAIEKHTNRIEICILLMDSIHI